MALFRTMRFLALVTLMMAGFQMCVGVLNYTDDPLTPDGYSILDKLSMANMKYSHPTCI